MDVTQLQCNNVGKLNKGNKDDAENHKAEYITTSTRRLSLNKKGGGVKWEGSIV